MKKVGFILIASLLVPTLYEGRKYYAYNKMVKKYQRTNNYRKVSFLKRVLNNA